MAKTTKEITTEYKREMAKNKEEFKNSMREGFAEIKSNGATKNILLVVGIILTIPLFIFGLWLLFIGLLFLWDAFIGL